MNAAPPQKTWSRVSRRQPCSVCNKPDWCTFSDQGACCMRVESARILKNGGWFHPFDAGRPTPPARVKSARNAAHSSFVTPAPLTSRRASNVIRPSSLRPAPIVKAAPETAVPHFPEMMRRWREQTNPEDYARLAGVLNVSAQSLQWLGAAWAADRRALAFPMFDAAASSIDRPCGIRLRTECGRKFAVTGSKSGIFIPYGALNTIPCERIFICEGPTDTAACLDMGLFALGRASCRGGEEMILSALDQLSPGEVVVVSDNDGPGIEGAAALLSRIKMRKVKITPPCKDMRAFAGSGGNAALMEFMLRNLLRS